jgi:diguanylate cyclase (GGDEF)-like protein/PAS domain S-box-containing protein
MGEANSLSILLPIFRSLFDQSLDNVAVYDMQANIAYCNPIVLNLLGENKDLTSAFPSFKDHAPFASYFKALNETILSGESSSILLTLQLPALNRVIHDFIHFSSIKNDEGSIIGVLAVGRDLDFYQQQQHEEVKKREYYLRALLDTFPFMVWMKDKESRFLACNVAFANVAKQLSVHDLEGKTDYDYFEAAAAKSYIEGDQQVMQDGLCLTAIEPIIKSDGETHWAETFKSAVVVNSQVIGTVGFARDVTKEQFLQSQVAKRQQDYMTLVRNLPITIVRYDLDCKRIFVSIHSDEHCGVSDKLYLFKTPEEQWSPYIVNLSASEFTDRLKMVMQTQKEQSFEIHSKQGKAFFVNQVKLIPEYDENRNVTGALTIATDITENAEYRQAIEHLAFHDALTDLPNRRLFSQALNKAIARAEQNHTVFAVLIMDLDHFKTINDTMGHAVGDKLLIGVADRIKNNADANYLFARMGGDEFAVLIHDYENPEALIAKSSNLLKQIVQPYEIDGAGYFVSASIGVACYPKDSRNVDDLIKYADSAMYSAKQKGRNNYQLYSPALTEGMRYHLEIETALRYALVNEELYLEFQPIFEIKTKRFIGVEALCRWNSASLGQVSPASFIQVAEESGLIVEIGQRVIKQAFIAAKVINDASAEVLSVSVNLSSRQFVGIDLLERIKRLLDETECEPSWIKFEITEGLLLQDTHEVHEMLDAFHALGIKISIDDFGTGYSALAYLNKFPIHQVKIDRSFVNEITTNRNHALLVKAIIAMVDSLGKELVAEGVETKEQADLLESYGCKYAQGFLISKSVPLDKFMSMLKK